MKVNLSRERMDQIFFCWWKIDWIVEKWEGSLLYTQNHSQKRCHPDLLYHEKQTSNSVMTSAGVSKLGETSLHFTESKAKIIGAYFRANILSKKIQEMERLSGSGGYISGGYNFPQDGVRAHNAKATLEWMYQRIFHLKCRLQTTQTSTHVAARVFCGERFRMLKTLKIDCRVSG